jgi:hypothetical protein
VMAAERLRTRSDRANEEYATQLEAFTQFSVQQADRVPEWRGMVEAFEKDEKQKNPYQMTTRGKSMRTRVSHSKLT